MKRIHNTTCDILHLNKKYNKEDERTFIFKPSGLWYAINNEWLEWCLDNMPHWIKPFIFELEINTSKVLIISTKKELDTFNNRYKKKLCEGIFGIDWTMVKRDYTGIEIINYHKLKWNNSLFDVGLWFTSWDVSSGCVWDLSIIKNIKKYKTPKKWFRVEIEN